MSTDYPPTLFLARRPEVAAAVYVVMVFALIFSTWSALSGIYDRRSEVAATTETLHQLEGRNRSAQNNSATAVGQIPSGSPFLEGQTVTQAGAALLQRVANAVSQVSGSVLSTQVDLLGPQSKDGYVSVLANCEVQQPALQRLLYDIEAGMPFLFIDQLSVEVPNTDGGPLRVTLAVSGQWQILK
jgi:general secretion pathway protein M